ncbi:MAG: radical SAM protein [Chloroflexota bacterium]|nr:radical SAM protein [Chloroflexota bacterium]
MIYGPVPSRRLGHSLGINNIPPKVCSYSCVYCQLGRTMKIQVERGAFYEPDEIARTVKGKIERVRKKGEPIDYLAFVPDGEPTLDANLGSEIELLKSSGIKIAVITNASLIWREDVRSDLQKADWVSLKVDAAEAETWRRIDRPQKSLRLNEILDGMLAFRDIFNGELTTETMFTQGINDDRKEIERIAGFLAELKPAKSYLAVPIRPPANKAISAAGEETINMAYQVFTERLSNVECLTGYEGNAFAFTGNVEDDLLSITSVHPMREDAVLEFLKKADADWDIVEQLLKDSRLVELEYEGRKFYLRDLSRQLGRST